MKNFVFKRALSIAKKEIHHVARDRFTLLMALGMPVMLVVFFGYVFDFDTRDIGLAVYDRDQTPLSRSIIDLFSASGFFKIDTSDKSTDPFELLRREKVKAALIIEPGFAKNIRRNKTAEIQVAIDGADNQAAATIANYLNSLSKSALNIITPGSSPPSITLKTRFLYNHELNSRWFIIPGLVVVVIGMLSVLLTALTVAREWEMGLMGLLLSTPVRPMEIIIGKLAPYTGLSPMGVGLVYGAARWGFGIPFKGNHALFLLSCLMFLSTTLSQGLLISVLTRQQQLAMQFSNLVGLLPNLLLSGFIFPTENMPPFFQFLTSVLPARWFMIICRSLFLKGSHLIDLAGPLAILALINTFFLILAAKKFKKDLE